MRVLLLAGLMTAVSAPFAAAAENEVIDCQITDPRRAPAEQRLDQAPQSPAVTVARPTVAQREAEPPRPPAAERRRGGKPVPDAQLIQPRGTL
ncbi:MAG: hypothetical protein R3C30_13585 [Hyphomonadaceae bacterium]